MRINCKRKRYEHIITNISINIEDNNQFSTSLFNVNLKYLRQNITCRLSNFIYEYNVICKSDKRYCEKTLSAVKVTIDCIAEAKGSVANNHRYFLG